MNISNEENDRSPLNTYSYISWRKPTPDGEGSRLVEFPEKRAQNTDCKEPRNWWVCRGKIPNEQHISLLVSGHWSVGEHAARLGIPYKTSCRNCMTEGEKKTLNSLPL